MGAVDSRLRGNDGLVGKFQKRGHLRTFQDIQAWRLRLEEAAMSGFGADRLFIEVFSVINCHVAPVDLLDLAASGGTLCCTCTMVHMYYGTEMFSELASAKCQWRERDCMVIAA